MIRGHHLLSISRTKTARTAEMIRSIWMTSKKRKGVASDVDRKLITFSALWWIKIWTNTNHGIKERRKSMPRKKRWRLLGSLNKKKKLKRVDMKTGWWPPTKWLRSSRRLNVNAVVTAGTMMIKVLRFRLCGWYSAVCWNHIHCVK